MAISPKSRWFINCQPTRLFLIPGSLLQTLLSRIRIKMIIRALLGFSIFRPVRLRLISLFKTTPLDNCVVLDHIPYIPDLPALERRLSFCGDIRLISAILPAMLERVVSLVRPRAVYKTSHVSGKTRDSVSIDGVRFNSILLRVNLDRAERVFPYVLTCGPDSDRFQEPEGDAAARYCLEVILNSALETAAGYLQDHLTRQFGLDYLWSLHPGDFQDWPAAQRKPLFSLLGCAAKRIGVSLKGNYAFVPATTRAGLFYFAETEFEACQLCSREPCMGRRAPYSPALAQKRHLKISSSCSRLTGAV
jgi:hypothetical protein